MDRDSESANGPHATIELSGAYDEVVARLDSPARTDDLLVPLVDDVETVLETVVGIDGGTRSVIAEELPADTAVEFDGETVVETLQVLAGYDLVALEGNTWRPGPALHGSDRFDR